MPTMTHWKIFILLLIIAVQSKSSNGSASNGYRSVAYFGNWAIYGNFTPYDLPASSLTHVLYAFADINPDTGEVFLSDPRADIEKMLSGDSDKSGTTLYGCLGQLYALKTQNRALKVLLSIGGWTYASHFASPISSSRGRSTFASSVVSLVKTYGLDGVDIDWEYPADESQGANMISLLQAVRGALDAYGNLLIPPYHFTLTAAFPGPHGYQYLSLAEMDRYVDFINYMAYDYTGYWSTVSGDLANLFPSRSIPESTPFNTEAVISYISESISPNKTVLGIPLYGRAFNDTNGLGETFSGSRTYDIRDLPPRGCAEVNDGVTGSSYCYGNRELISYDTFSVLNDKAAFIHNKGLGGAMFWETSMDDTGDKSIVRFMADAMGTEDGSALDKTPNQLVYPDSPYNNILRCTLDTATKLASTTATLSTVLPVSATGSSPVLSEAPAATSTAMSTGTSAATTVATSAATSALTPTATSATTIAATSTVASPSCIPGACGTYQYLDCPDGLCTCGIDSGRNPVCVLNHNCDEGSICSANSDCCSGDNSDCGMTCLVDSCCRDGEGYCVQLTDGCLDSPSTTVPAPSPTPHNCRRLFGPMC